MGLKHVETIKSVILLVLITLSIILTFLIWTYTPKYKFKEERATVDISIAEGLEKKDFASIIKPYKLLLNLEEGLKGTVDAAEIDPLIEALKKWSISNPRLEDNKFNEEKLAAFMRQKNRIVFLFQGEVPLPVYDSILNIENSNVTEISFDRIVIEWDDDNEAVALNFISKKNNSRYKSKAKIVDIQDFHRSVLNKRLTYDDYVDVMPEEIPFIAVPANPIELTRNTYFQNEKDEISPTRFRSALFSDPNAVRRSQVGVNREDYQDNHALMKVDTEKKQLQYVHPVAESRELAIPSELLEDTIDFVNEHGGWTDDYRYSDMNFKTRYVKFQLYVRGLPVLEGTTLTEIEQVWGDEKVYQYKRPYYSLDESLPSETDTVTLPSGVEVAKQLLKSKEVDFSTIEEIIPAYYMEHNAELNIFMLEPYWYYLKKGNWIRFSPDKSGGEKIGLE